jgi:hypothetical protein
MKEITVRDCTNYIVGLNFNGGHYRESTHYLEVVPGFWEVTYTSSADFAMCEGCGRYGDCDCDPEYVSTAEVDAAVDYAYSHMDDRHHPDAVGGYEVVETEY